MRGAWQARDDPRVPEPVGSVGVALSPPGVPVAIFGQPPRLPIPDDAAGSDPELAWQSSIGQFIFLQSLVHERI